MLRPLAALCALWFVSCGPAPTDPARVWDVSPASLYHAYRDGSDRWSGQRVRVALAAGEYTVSPSETRWHAGRDTSSPDIVFHGPPPQDAGRNLFVHGTVRGKVRSDSPRGYYIAVDDCRTEPR